MVRLRKLAARHLHALQTLAPKLPADTFLAGGTAIALRLTHRTSRDLDLFTGEDPLALIDELELLDTFKITSRSRGTLHLELHGVPTSIIRYRYPALGPLDELATIPVPLASVPDLVCMKLSAIAARGARRDFWDLVALMTAESISLPTALDWYRQKFAKEDIGYVVRSLVYFDDAESEPSPNGLTNAIWESVTQDLRQWVRALSPR